MRSSKMWMVFMCLTVSFFARIESLSVTVNDVECVYEYVLYEGDTVSGNFVVVDHDIFWSSDHPGIDFTVTTAAGNTVHSIKGTSEHLDPINVKIAELREALESVTAEQKYLKARDARHRHTNESTRKRVVFYTVGEYLLLAAVSALQVIYIRRLFSKSVAYNRV
ncbi:Endoplasmic reticulum vesicle protein 25 [Glycine soja]|nr:Endoplasmic reticulum vesicle protein 25 [Glycine soja]